MINSRDLQALHPVVLPRATFLLNAFDGNPYLIKCGVKVIVISTLRDYEAQDALYAQGRTKPGKIVTNAKAGESWHNFGCALDVLPLRHGKPIWGTGGNGIDNDPTDDDTDDLEVWQSIGLIGEKCGFEWAGNWRTFKEFPHFQYTGGLTLEQARNGARPK